LADVPLETDSVVSPEFKRFTVTPFSEALWNKASAAGWKLSEDRKLVPPLSHFVTTLKPGCLILAIDEVQVSPVEDLSEALETHCSEQKTGELENHPELKNKCFEVVSNVRPHDDTVIVAEVSPEMQKCCFRLQRVDRAKKRQGEVSFDFFNPKANLS
jgi:hypothetical protein